MNEIWFRSESFNKIRVSSHSVRNLKWKINQDWCFDNLFICGAVTVNVLGQ